MPVVPHAKNRRRNGYELTRQRDMVPVAFAAAILAVMAHAAAWIFFPGLLQRELDMFIPSSEKVEDVIRVVVTERPEVEEKEAEPVDSSEQTEPEEVLSQEPVEIDILDVIQDVDIDLAPGETSIVLPAPASQEEEPEPIAAEDLPKGVDLGQLVSETPLPAAPSLPEPTPLNNNEVVANVAATPDDSDSAADLMERNLRDDASKGTPLPGDTRTLAQLMGVDNPGQQSGVARLGADVLFAFDKCQLKNSARVTMLQLAALIHKNPGTNFIIEGHTDSFGGEDYNALLSLQRAASVREWLMKNGVPVTHVYIRACGNTSPLADVTKDKDGQSLNRRVEIHMRSKGQELPAGCVPHTVKVDTTTPVKLQLAAGVRAPVATADGSSQGAAGKADVGKVVKAALDNVNSKVGGSVKLKSAQSAKSARSAKSASSASKAAKTKNGH